MQLYPRAERILVDLAQSGFPAQDPVPVDILNRFDQLHYHGTDALDVAIKTCGIKPGQKILEIGSGWGGCARYISHASGAHVTAVELQADYHAVGKALTARSGLSDRVTHVHADFLSWSAPQGGFDHVVSWLALFHIPKRTAYQSRIVAALKPGGTLFVEDLYEIAPPPEEEADDFKAHLFPNSLAPLYRYKSSLRTAGLDLLNLEDMTSNWASFTADRLIAFRKNRRSYEAVHGVGGYRIIETFYIKMAGYFSRSLVGGLRLHARRQ
ncbi:cyclopropane-fatty-acyl-phospholipid synthase family protein [uncultured Ruegeria sp.]|uniref:SAM-dependent methyltransferase n=1 Tax=uncultured Ruegeria sp. TaxID=259304 RepID=UPI00262C8B27|nr:class I SAM-dependent methyltransferase [uncultured Ruegeria sp.]